MEVQLMNPTDLCMEVVSEDSASIFSAFSCGNEEIDKYFREKAAVDAQNVCYLYRNKVNGDVIGAAALCCSGVNVGNNVLVQLIPAIKIDYFAISVAYQDVRFPGSEPSDHFYISDAFLCELIKEIEYISEQYVGAKFIILYSVPDATHFYDRNKFGEFATYMKPEQYMYLEGCKPMFMALS